MVTQVATSVIIAAISGWTIIHALDHKQLFAPFFQGDTWSAWRVFLKTLYALPLTDADMEVYRRLTGRQNPPSKKSREAWLIVGRGGGKSLIAALTAVYQACFVVYTHLLAPGEVATITVIAADRRQARTIMRYIGGFFDAIPMLGQMVVNRTRESFELNNRVCIEVHTCSFRAVRGYRIVCAICDEVAFWRSDESANPDTEVINAIRPSLGRTPGSLLICISSPYARRGALWEAYRKHHGREDDPILVWQADTLSMNPSFDADVIKQAYEDDPSMAAAEYGAEFRRDIETFVPKEAVEACVMLDRFEVPYSSSQTYRAFVDPSGGSQDSWTLAVAHREKENLVLDFAREWRPPFSPEAIVNDCVSDLRRYRISQVTGDRYGGEFPRELFRKRGIAYQVSDKTKSDIYRELLPPINSGRVELLDNQRLINQLCNLERRTARGGKDSIDHAPRSHDDLINAAAGALISASGAFGPKSRVVDTEEA
jgi:hypothetical protein